MVDSAAYLSAVAALIGTFVGGVTSIATSCVFVVGDASSLVSNGRPVPGVAQAAIQEGHYVGRLIARQLKGRDPKHPFRYFDKGNMAVVGKGFAILQSGDFRVSGFFAWLAWAAVHLQFLAQSNLRVSVFMQWVWTYLTGQRGSVLIVKHRSAEAETPDARAADLHLVDK